MKLLPIRRGEITRTQVGFSVVPVIRRINNVSSRAGSRARTKTAACGAANRGFESHPARIQRILEHWPSHCVLTESFALHKPTQDPALAANNRNLMQLWTVWFFHRGHRRLYGPFRTEGFPAFYSMDSGATWTEVGPSGPPLFGNSYPGFNDPQVSFDANGNVFLGWGVFVPPQDLSVVQYYLLKSVDQGKTYSYLTNPPLANNVTYLFPDGSYKTPCSARTTFPVIDYPKLAIDKSSVSHYEGNIYVNGAIWFNATGTGCMAYPAFARSTDGGNTWSNRTVISDFSGYADRSEEHTSELQ